MGAWLLKAFSGEQPRISANLLAPNAAQAAVNVRLDDGALTPLRDPQRVYSFPGYSGGFQTIYRYQDTWLGWPGIVNAVPGPVASDRLYITGDGVPKMRVGDTIYNLAVPFPTVALAGVVSGTATGTEGATTRIYVYTFVTGYGEESEPCPASADINWLPGQTVTLSGFQAAPAGRNITKQRIYRTQTGSSGTDLYFIAERDASAANFVDDVAVDAFGEVLPSRAYNAPPDGLSGLIAMPNGMMAGFVGSDLYFCEPWLPHAWPQAYSLSTDFDIVALGAIGTSLIIMTTGNPYLAQGTDPVSMQMVKMETNLPCINARGVVDLGYAIAYPSHEGLVLVTAGGQAALATEQLFNRTGWQLLNPGTLCAGQLSGRYIASYNSQDADGKPLIGTIIIASSAPTFLSRSDVRARVFYYDVSEGALYFLNDAGDIMRLDPPAGATLNLYWRSKPLLLTSPENFGVIQIDGDPVPTAAEVRNINEARAAANAANVALLTGPLGSELNGTYLNHYRLAGDGLVVLPSVAKKVTVSVYADRKLVAAVSTFGGMVRLPSGFRARTWEIDVFGTVRVQQIALAATATELRQVAAS